MKLALGAFAISSLALLCASLAPQSAPPEWSEHELGKMRTHTPLPDPPRDPTNFVADDLRAARLGQRLFFDKRLSGNGEISCATCHDPAREFADGRQLSQGMKLGTRNVPSLWNTAYQRWFFWDGHADSLWAQARGPIESDIEMGGDRAHVARVIANDAALRASYVELFGALPDVARLPEHARPMANQVEHADNIAWNKLNADEQRALNRVMANVGKALAAYERKLVRRNAPFDRYVAGLANNDEAAARDELGESARRGLKLFLGKGNCRLCHGGSNFSDGEFHNIGIPPLGGGKPTDAARHEGIGRVKADPFNALGEFSDARDGEAALQITTLAQNPQSFGEFKTPSLRNVALSAPYMQQGQFATLRDVMHFYSTLEGVTQVGHHQEQTLKPLALSEQESADLVAFLEALTGELPDAIWLAPPAER